MGGDTKRKKEKKEWKNGQSLANNKMEWEIEENDKPKRVVLWNILWLFPEKLGQTQMQPQVPQFW